MAPGTSGTAAGQCTASLQSCNPLHAGSASAQSLGLHIAWQGLRTGMEELLASQYPVHAVRSRPKGCKAFQSNPAPHCHPLLMLPCDKP